jgi:hypothetical protein
MCAELHVIPNVNPPPSYALGGSIVHTRSARTGTGTLPVVMAKMALQ